MSNTELNVLNGLSAENTRSATLCMSQRIKRNIKHETRGTTEHSILSSLFSDIKGGTCPEVVQNRVLSRILGSKRDEVRGGWKKQHNEGIHILYSSPGIARLTKSKRWDGMGRSRSKNGERRNAYRRARKKEPLGISKSIWTNNIKIELREDGAM
jgi:hypothetical protein